MGTQLMFLDRPAYLDRAGAERCELPAEVRCIFIMRSTDGPLASAMIRCPAGHWFTGPIESLTPATEPARGAGLLWRAPKTGGSYHDPLFERTWPKTTTTASGTSPTAGEGAGWRAVDLLPKKRQD
jgi:hypothetical protein